MNKKNIKLLILCIFIIGTSFYIHTIKLVAKSKLLEKAETPYGDVFVYETRSGRRMLKFHLKTNMVETMYNPKDPLELNLDYTKTILISFPYIKQHDKMLLIGLGGGTLPSYINHYMPEKSFTTVEINPKVFEVAKKYFDFKETNNFNVEITDGRMFIKKSQEKYDLIMLDAYKAFDIPFHLLTKEFYQEVEAHLENDGVVAQNVANGIKLLDGIIATMKNVFDNVEIYAKGNEKIVIAYNGKKKTKEFLFENATKLQKQYNFRYSLVGLLNNRSSYKGKPADILTDDFAPVNFLNMK